MGLLNRIFGSTESIAERSVKDQEDIERVWNDYLRTVPIKKQIANRLPYLFGEKRAHLQKLLEILKLELIDIRIGEKEEDDLIKNIQALDHSKKIKRVERLDEGLMHVSTRYEYVHALLFHLYAILKSEANTIEKMKKSDLGQYRKLIEELKSQLAVEDSILSKISNIATFHQLLVDLVKGERVIASMDATERILYKKMQAEMKKIFSNKLKEGMLYDLTHGVFNAVEYKVHNAIANATKIKPEGVSEYHSTVDLEFVNRPEFVTLVRQMARVQKISDVMTEPAINVFVHLFREWYNHQRG